MAFGSVKAEEVQLCSTVRTQAAEPFLSRSGHSRGWARALGLSILKWRACLGMPRLAALLLADLHDVPTARTVKPKPTLS